MSVKAEARFQGTNKYEELRKRNWQGQEGEKGQQLKERAKFKNECGGFIYS